MKQAFRNEPIAKFIACLLRLVVDLDPHDDLIHAIIRDLLIIIPIYIYKR